MTKAIIIKHLKGAPGLRFFGLGPKLYPRQGLNKLKQLLHENTSWGKERTIKDIKKSLKNSDVIISIWCNKEIVGFGRALSDGIYRGVLWDIVIAKKYQGYGYGKKIVNLLLSAKIIKNTEKIYLMTTNKKDFYSQLSFDEVTSQNLLIREIKS